VAQLTLFSQPNVHNWSREREKDDGTCHHYQHVPNVSDVDFLFLEKFQKSTGCDLNSANFVSTASSIFEFLNEITLNVLLMKNEYSSGHYRPNDFGPGVSDTSFV